MSYPNEAIVKNVLSILFSKRSFLPEEQKLFGSLCRELGLSKDDYSRYNAEWQKQWQKDPGLLLQGGNKEEDQTILAFMTAGAYFDNMVYSGEKELLLRFCVLSALPARAVERFISIKWTFDFADGVIDDALDIRARLLAGGGAGAGEPTIEDGSLHVDPRAGARKEQVDKLEGYVATQVGKEGIDELQALFMCSQLGLNAALSGPPGIGKTESVLELARLLELPLFTKTCSARTSESHIISHPVLMERNGVSVTSHEDGALCRAMIGPGVFYGDEYNLLKEDVQKRMNSAFDGRRAIDRNDGSTVRAKPGFMAVISYNPTQDFGRRDLEDSVADRFVHFSYKDWPSDLRAYISVLRADPDTTPPFTEFGLALETRGIALDGTLAVKDRGAWVHFFTGTAVAEPSFRYHCRRTQHLSSMGTEVRAAREKLDAVSLSYMNLARAWSKFVDDVNELATTGKSWLLKELGLGDTAVEDDFETMVVHRASTRILSAALAHYRWLLSKGASPYLAQSYGTALIINQMAYGAFGGYKLRDRDNTTVLESIAKAFRLYQSDTVFNTDLGAKKQGAPAKARKS